jgi:hypothetical protein
MLDNTVAGGIPNGYTSMQCIVKECEEEASLAAHVVTPHIKQAGAVTYFYRFVVGHPSTQDLPRATISLYCGMKQ